MKYHSPVLLKESIDGLNIKPDGARLFATKKNTLFLKIITITERDAIKENMPSEIQAAGT